MKKPKKIKHHPYRLHNRRRWAGLTTIRVGPGNHAWLKGKTITFGPEIVRVTAVSGKRLTVEAV